MAASSGAAPTRPLLRAPWLGPGPTVPGAESSGALAPSLLAGWRLSARTVPDPGASRARAPGPGARGWPGADGPRCGRPCSPRRLPVLLTTRLVHAAQGLAQAAVGPVQPDGD